jgi:hypothetical protein
VGKEKAERSRGECLGFVRLSGAYWVSLWVGKQMGFGWFYFISDIWQGVLNVAVIELDFLWCDSGFSLGNGWVIDWC